jgi:hypothetical protein
MYGGKNWAAMTEVKPKYSVEVDGMIPTSIRRIELRVKWTEDEVSTLKDAV